MISNILRVNKCYSVAETQKEFTRLTGKKIRRRNQTFRLIKSNDNQGNCFLILVKKLFVVT